jgi:hypothetical protein
VRRLEIEHPVVVVDDVLDERPLDPQTRLANDPARLAELQDQRLLGLVDDEERAHRQDAADHQHHADDREKPAVHWRRPIEGCAPAGGNAEEDGFDGFAAAAAGAEAAGAVPPSRLGKGR